ncbi:hypothetical protein RB195_025310 [Necator americanus]|uniref:Uncharacterized protein n=1 Tax=Necator americanus TaxID=51031 RepID=A0ABR1ERQ6_NECAM
MMSVKVLKAQQKSSGHFCWQFQFDWCWCFGIVITNYNNRLQTNSEQKALGTEVAHLFLNVYIKSCTGQIAKEQPFITRKNVGMRHSAEKQE